MQGGIDLTPGFRRDARDTLEVLRSGLQRPLGGAEVLEECALARRSESGERVENRLARPGVAALPVEAKCEAMRLVPDPLQALQARRCWLETYRVGLAR